jgi:DNA modification methylase
MAKLHVETCCCAAMDGMDEGSVDLVLADPPYGDVVAHDWDDAANQTPFDQRWVKRAARVLRPGGALLVYGSPERLALSRLLLHAVDHAGLRLVQQLAWCYTQGGGSRVSQMKRYAVQHELLLWLEKPGGQRVFNAAEGVEHYSDEDRAVALAKGKRRVTDASLDRGRPPRSFLDFPRENSRSSERQLGSHPCMKPLALCEHLVKLHSNPGDVVLVPFAGSGSEMVASAQLGRTTVGAETSKEYCDLVRRRLESKGVALSVEKAGSAG